MDVHKIAEELYQQYEQVSVLRKQLFTGLDDDLIHNALNPIENVKIRNVPGGPSPEMVQLAIDNMNIFLDNEFEKQGI